MSRSTIQEGLKQPRAVSEIVDETSLSRDPGGRAGIVSNQLGDSLSMPRLAAAT